MTTVTISLPESLKEFIDSQLASKGYPDVSDYFSSLLRDAQQREAHSGVELLLEEALQSEDEDIPLNSEFWQSLRSEAKDLANDHTSSRR